MIIDMPEFGIVWCPVTDDEEVSRDGFCGACGATDHRAIDTTREG